MAIKPCKECGNQVSDKAESCSQCGAKVKKEVPRWAVWLVFISIIMAIFASCQSSNSPSSSASSNSDGGLVSEPKSNWVSNSSTDEMRGTKSQTTYTSSVNKVIFEFPYGGGSNLNLMVRNNAGQNDVIITISKGQFLCGMIDGCEVNFKFDNNPVQSITMIESDSHDSDILFIKYPKTANSVIQKLKTSQKLIIEPKFYQEGSKQFTFELSGFKEP